MKLYLKKTVLQAARERMARLFAEFPNIIVGFSGGKDSTVVLQLALEQARALNRLPLRVVFVDQEAEWRQVIDYAREVMSNPEIEPLWFQMPIRIYNATDPNSPWLMCWEEGGDWMRPKEPNAITANVYGTDRFAELFPAIIRHHFPDTPTAYVAGVRAEESPTRFMGLTGSATYKEITWGNALDKQRSHYTFYPLYDWSYRDVWKAIQEHKWPYCVVYDLMHQHGVGLNEMRVSNLHHETAVHTLFFLQEIDRETYGKLTARLSGTSTAAHAGKDDFFGSDVLPWMFPSWQVYRNYLVKVLIGDADHRRRLEERFAKDDAKYCEFPQPDVIWRHHVFTVLTNDYHGTKLASFFASPPMNAWRQWWFKGKITKKAHLNPFIDLSKPNPRLSPA